MQNIILGTLAVLTLLFWAILIIVGIWGCGGGAPTITGPNGPVVVTEPVDWHDAAFPDRKEPWARTWPQGRKMNLWINLSGLAPPLQTGNDVCIPNEGVVYYGVLPDPWTPADTVRMTLATWANQWTEPDSILVAGAWAVSNATADTVHGHADAVAHTPFCGNVPLGRDFVLTRN
jgi:hypothetical protein